MVNVALVSLVVGLIAGWVGQKSGFCSIGGLRDYLLARDTRLLWGIIAVFVASWAAYPLLIFVLQALPTGIHTIIINGTSAGIANTNPTTITPVLMLVLLVGGIGVGFVSVIADGCPFRQHVLAGHGLNTAKWYLLGFYLSGLVFEIWSIPMLRLIFR